MMRKSDNKVTYLYILTESVLFLANHFDKYMSTTKERTRSLVI